MYSEISSLLLITKILSLTARVPEARPRNSVIEGGFPHSEIRGSKLVRSSPRLIAAYHLLHSLSAPRHPPNALKSLDRSHHQCPSRSAAGRTIVQWNLRSANSSPGRTSIRKTSLLRIVPTACGQAADIALSRFGIWRIQVRSNLHSFELSSFNVASARRCRVCRANLH